MRVPGGGLAAAGPGADGAPDPGASLHLKKSCCRYLCADTSRKVKLLTHILLLLTGVRPQFLGFPLCSFVLRLSWTLVLAPGLQHVSVLTSSLFAFYILQSWTCAQNMLRRVSWCRAVDVLVWLLSLADSSAMNHCVINVRSCGTQSGGSQVDCEEGRRVQ